MPHLGSFSPILAHFHLEPDFSEMEYLAIADDTIKKPLNL